MKKASIKNKIFKIMTILAFVLTGITAASSSITAVDAGAFCKSMGAGMRQTQVSRNVISPDSKNRKWTVNELFTTAARFTTYYGEGESTWFYSEKVDRGIDRVGDLWNDPEVKKNLNEARSFTCALGFGSISNFLPNVFLMLSSMIVTLTSMSLNLVLGDDFITGSLINVIGGDGVTTTGLIGTFLYSLYMPMVIFAGMFLAVTLVYKGLIQRKIREAFMDIIWSVSAVIIGLIFMFKPLTLATLPQTITSQITTCMIGALSGQNCLNGEVTPPSLLTGTECLSSTSEAKDSAGMLVNSMNCTIWKTFVLEEWALEQFGAPYNELYTYDKPEGGEFWSSLPKGTGEKYCVTLGSSKAASEFGPNETVILDEGNRICNVALYQLYLKTNVHDSVNQGKNIYEMKGTGSEEYDDRWYDIIVPMAKTKESWQAWNGDWRGLGRLASTFLSFISTLAAGYILFTLSILGAVYKITGVVLMAFSPLFLLMAVEPSRGKKIFLGWLESIVSSILKYFAITMMIIVALTMYSAVLNNITGMSAVIAVIVLTATLHMYREEIISIIGASNLGGKRLSNKVKSMSDEVQKKTGRITKAAAGGAIGSMMASKQSRKATESNMEEGISRLKQSISSASNDEERNHLKTLLEEQEKELAMSRDKKTSKAASREALKEGASSSTERILRRGTSVTGMAFSQANRTKNQLEKEERDRMEKLFKEENKIEAASAAYDNANKVDNSINEVSSLKEEIKAQRDPVKYKGELSENDKKALDEFADKVINASSEDVLNISENQEAMQDPNKSAIIGAEINARIKAKTLKGEASGSLSRSSYADSSNLTAEEASLNLDILRDDFLESHKEEDLDKYLDLKYQGSTTKADKESREIEFNKYKKVSEIYRETGKKHVRKTPTREQVEKDPEKYVVNPEGKELSIPSHLKEKADEAEKADEDR